MSDKNTKRPAAKLFSDANLNESEQIELMSYVCELLCKGIRPTKSLERIRTAFPKCKSLVNRESVMNLVFHAAELDLLTYKLPFANQLAKSLGEEMGWDADRIAVVHSRSLEHVAQEAARRLLAQIRSFKTYGKLQTVHIGFAGGRLLRLVAEQLAKLLREPSRDNPERIVFHAMVAAFSEDDFEADPNNFITFFLQEELAVKISFVPIAAPGIVETKYRHDLRKFREIDEVYRAAEKLNIIVSSAGDWEDEHSTTQQYLKEVDGGDVQALNDYPAIGDLLWQPLSADGPIDMDSGDFTFRPNTLVDLKDLPGAINERGVRVLLALGMCGKCGKPKGKLLNTIMGLQERLVTDIVTNSPNVYDALRVKWQMPAPITKKAK